MCRACTSSPRTTIRRSGSRFRTAHSWASMSTLPGPFATNSRSPARSRSGASTRSCRRSRPAPRMPRWPPWRSPTRPCRASISPRPIIARRRASWPGSTASSAPSCPKPSWASVSGVQGGTAHEAYLKTFFPAATVQSYGSAAEVRAALTLRRGRPRVRRRHRTGRLACRARRLRPAAASSAARSPRPASSARAPASRCAKATARCARRSITRLARLAAKGVYSDLYLKYFPISIY